MELPITVGENDPVIRTSSSFDQTDRSSVLRIRPGQPYLHKQSFDVAVMKETLLLVELETHGFCVDLRVLSKIILSDLGATLQVLRLAGREYGNAVDRPARVEDCIADLGIQACIEAMSPRLIACDRRSRVVPELWKHSREIAKHSMHLAEQTLEIDPDQAYLVGLCHSIGSLPGVMGMSGKRRQKVSQARVGLELAREWSLPCCVLRYFSDVESRENRFGWAGIVKAAHRRAGEPSGECLADGPHPQLLWAV